MVLSGLVGRAGGLPSICSPASWAIGRGKSFCLLPPGWETHIEGYVARTNYDEYAFLAWKKNSSYGYTVTTQLYGRRLLQGWKPARSPGCKTEHGWGVPGTDGLALHFRGQRGIAEGCRHPHAAPEAAPTASGAALRIRLEDPPLWPPAGDMQRPPGPLHRSPPGSGKLGAPRGAGAKGKGRLRPQPSCLL